MKNYCPLILLIFLSTCNNKDFSSEFYKISKEQLQDKIKGAWAAQTIGVTFGGPTEFRYLKRIIPDSVKIVVEKQTIVKINGSDKQEVGMIASKIKSLRPPEPYKGKGIRYVDEYVRRKAGKTIGATT